jgi:hypothetical protein
MRRFLKLLDKRLSLPIQWLTRFVEKETDKKRAEFWRLHEKGRDELDPEQLKEHDELSARIREWDEKQKRR